MRAFSGEYPFGITNMVGEDGFEPSKLEATDLQSAPFGHSGILPLIHPKYFPNELWSWWTDSNPRPADYKSAALPTELHQLMQAISFYSLHATYLLYHISFSLSRESLKFNISFTFDFVMHLPYALQTNCKLFKTSLLISQTA